MEIAALAAVAVFVAVSSLLLWLAGSREVSAEARLGKLVGSSRTRPIDDPFGDRVIMPLVEGLASWLMELLPHAFVDRTRRKLLAAGRPVTATGFFAIVIFGAVLVPVAALLVIVAGNAADLSLTLAGAIGSFAVIGVALPFVWLTRKVRGRKTAILKSLPDAFDLVTVSVEVGLGLDAALRHVSERQRGPLSSEIRQMLREVGMGRARREALEDMAERVDVKELKTFVNAVVQAEQLGTSLGRVLRSQSTMLRIQRRQRIEEMSRKAPVKLVFPLVFCIMPSFFVVTLGPIGIRLSNILGGS